MLSGKEILLRFASGFPWLWRFIAHVPILRTWVNRLFINSITSSTRGRPHPLSLWGPQPTSGSPSADYISWTGLVDRTYTGRHLPPAPDDYVASLPDPEGLRKLFQRGERMTPCPKSSALFSFFAQWFTDSFLRTDPDDFRKNTSNHEIDLCQIYGLCAADTSLIRSGRGGELKMQRINGQEYPPYLFELDGVRVKDEFLDLSYIDRSKADFRNDSCGRLRSIRPPARQNCS
jgi:prostaglandin-endoperoxide synthase 2